MKKINNLNRIILMLLVFTMIFCLCSCKSKDENESTLPSENTGTVTASTETTGVITETEPSESETQTTETTTQTTSQTEAVTQTQAQTEIITQAVAPTGVETVTDGNKTVVFPAQLRTSQNRYPVVAWANGTGCPTQLYKTLIDTIANAGYIVVADSTVMSGNGEAQIDSINYIINKNGDSSSVFFNKVDTVNIGVCGQSQGGKSCINAAKKDSRIRAVVSIAGASSADEADGIKVPCLFLTATNDNIVRSGEWCLPSYNAVDGRAAYASLKGGNHLSFNSMSGYTIDWFNAYLKNDSNAKAVFTDGGKLSCDSNWQDFKNKN